VSPRQLTCGRLLPTPLALLSASSRALLKTASQHEGTTIIDATSPSNISQSQSIAEAGLCISLVWPTVRLEGTVDGMSVGPELRRVLPGAELLSARGALAEL